MQAASHLRTGGTGDTNINRRVDRKLGREVARKRRKIDPKASSESGRAFYNPGKRKRAHEKAGFSIPRRRIRRTMAQVVQAEPRAVFSPLAVNSLAMA